MATFWTLQSVSTLAGYLCCRVIALLFALLHLFPGSGASCAGAPAIDLSSTVSSTLRLTVHPDTSQHSDLATGYDTLVRRYRSWRRLRNIDPHAGPELGLLIVDETVTKLGGDFYRLFHQNGRMPDVVGTYTVTVREQPLPNRGTRIEVRVNGSIAARFRLQPRLAQIEQAARYAADLTARFIENGRGGLRIQ